METTLSSAIVAIARSSVVAISASADRMAKAGLCAIVAVGLAASAIGCALAALWIWEVPRLGPAGAPLAVAAALLAGCLAVLALMRYTARRRPPSPPAIPPELLLADARQLFKHHKAAILLAVLIAGLIAGRNEK
jgi:Na+-driven multidrug efflux pump